MLSRFSQVHSIKIKTVIIGSVTQLGDSHIINGLSRAIAVQREAEIFYGNEGDFSHYSIFREPIPLPPIDDEVSFQRINLTPCLHVSKIDITGVSSSSVVHIGNSDHVYMEARIKHIRQLLNHKE